MTTERDPIRLADARGEAPAAVRDALQAGRGELPSAAVLARLAAKLPPPGSPGGSGLRLRAPGPGGAAPAAVASMLPGALVGAALGLVVAGAMSVWMPAGEAEAGLSGGAREVAGPGVSDRRGGDSSVGARNAGDERAGERHAGDRGPRGGDREVAPGAADSPAGPPSGGSGQGRVGGSASAVTPGLAAPPPDSTSGVASGASGDGAGGAAAPLADTESALLQRAQQALSGRPSAALGLANEHLARYPGGMFAQEREVIAISALVAMGRTGEARSRAAGFVAAYPRSAHRPRIEALAPSNDK